MSNYKRCTQDTVCYWDLKSKKYNFFLENIKRGWIHLIQHYYQLSLPIIWTPLGPVALDIATVGSTSSPDDPWVSVLWGRSTAPVTVPSCRYLHGHIETSNNFFLSFYLHILEIIRSDLIEFDHHDSDVTVVMAYPNLIFRIWYNVPASYSA